MAIDHSRSNIGARETAKSDTVLSNDDLLPFPDELLL